MSAGSLADPRPDHLPDLQRAADLSGAEGIDEQQAAATVVYLEHLTGSLFLENPVEVSRYTVVFDHLRAEALGTAPSIDLMARVAAELG